MDLMEEQLALRGVQLEDIASIVFDLQSQYYPDLNLATCLEAVRKVLKKRDVQYTILTGIALDTLAEQCLLPEPLQTLFILMNLIWS